MGKTIAYSAKESRPSIQVEVLCEFLQLILVITIVGRGSPSQPEFAITSSFGDYCKGREKSLESFPWRYHSKVEDSTNTCLPLRNGVCGRRGRLYPMWNYDNLRRLDSIL